MTHNNNTTAIRFSDTEKNTIRIAAYGAVTLMAAATTANGSPHKTATRGSIALASTTGPIGHVLAAHPKGKDLAGKSVAAIADRVLPALTESITLLHAKDPHLADNLRTAITTALATAQGDQPATPTTTDMIDQITTALDA
ncbi:hypothetical protein LX16_1243 [Stackebrandtia albiflava]|uniref:Uncharacterized protein n=1 Tax=Stackebrandtia albiflava TaxID=406432 RepID=A0A562VCE5_9ACTN|nr:hypothetical protein [Stackebrandtia albiflava]TWJ15532.1 hypothetical protein LX16_1243 [Stackebrandtia albiflava]